MGLSVVLNVFFKDYYLNFTYLYILYHILSWHPYLSYLVELASYLAKMKDNRENLAIVSKVLDFEFFKLDYIAIDIIQKKKVCF